MKDTDDVAIKSDTSSMTTISSLTFRKWRRSAGFRQKEIARLLGLNARGQISRLEQGRGSVGLRMAIALEVLTGMNLEEVMPELYEAVEEETLARVTAMLIDIETSKSIDTQKKCTHLKRCQDRVITRHKQKSHVQKP